MLTRDEILNKMLARSRLHPESGCWIWAGPTVKGYGAINISGKSMRCHRLGYQLLVGEIPQELVLDHVAKLGCISRACWNPAHLEPVTQKENVRRGRCYIYKDVPRPKQRAIPKPCPICEKMIRNTNLSAHIRRQHGIADTRGMIPRLPAVDPRFADEKWGKCGV